MQKVRPTRYNTVAIGLHWLLAAAILLLLVIGKYMVSLAEDDPLRFTLTQWHKTCGVVILLLAIFRLLWRLSYKAPRTTGTQRWQTITANVSHVFLYVLLIAAPLTGWFMVSASPLNIDTVIYKSITWPHIPALENLPDKERFAPLLHHAHYWVTGTMIAILLLHFAAVIKHVFIDKDEVLRGMLPQKNSGQWHGILASIILVTVLAVSALFTVEHIKTGNSQQLVAGKSSVTIIVVVTNDDTAVKFTNTTVDSQIDMNSLADSYLNAIVDTAVLETDNFQVKGSLPDKDFFDVENFPTANFKSTALEALTADSILVTGDLTIKNTTISETFEMHISETEEGRMAKGEFGIDRFQYKVGLDSQPNTDYVDDIVRVQFTFELTE